jgi:hypothetical protein
VLQPTPIGGGANNPKEALAEFVRALEARDVKKLDGLLAEPLRSMVANEFEDRARKLKEALGRGVPAGERPRLRYDSYYIELRFEDGVWKIVDFN